MRVKGSGAILLRAMLPPVGFYFEGRFTSWGLFLAFSKIHVLPPTTYV